MALPGTSNANEFYSAHILESVLAGDSKMVLERWTEDPMPEAHFKALRRSIETGNEVVANPHYPLLKLALRPNCSPISTLEPESPHAPSLSVFPT